jgi:hypothetical protein
MDASQDEGRLEPKPKIPEMENFQIEVTESWWEGDDLKRSNSTLTKGDSLVYNYKYADVRSSNQRYAHSFDFSSLLQSCLRQGLTEKKSGKRFPGGYVGKGNVEITIRAVCRIRYKVEKNGEPKSGEKK